MIFRETPLPGAFVIEPEKEHDERGFFARSWCAEAFAAHGLDADLRQCSISFNAARGTLRGMHYQAAPHAESKLVRCTRGVIHDVIVDLRSDAGTFLRHFGVTLAAGEHTMLYVPAGFAHGFLTLADDTEVFYQMSTPYVPDAARGFRFDDPAFAIDWPEAPRVVSGRDRAYADFVAPEVTTAPPA